MLDYSLYLILNFSYLVTIFLKLSFECNNNSIAIKDEKLQKYDEYNTKWGLSQSSNY